MILRILLLTIAAGLLASCASVSSDSRRQAIFVQSNPPDAKILWRGQLIGKTPSYVMVPRARKTELFLARGTDSKAISVPTKYRWGRSFAANLIFLTYAPVGWVIDLLSGAAWTPRDPSIVALNGAAVDFVYTPPPASDIAIAPPLASSVSISNAAARALEGHLSARKNDGVKVRSFQTTLPTFVQNGFDYDARGTVEDDNRLSYQLHSDLIAYSELTEEQGIPVLKTDIVDKRSQKTVERFDLKYEQFSVIEERAGWLKRTFSAIPNTLTLSSTNERLSYSLFAGNNVRYVDLEPAPADVWWEDGLRYVSAIGLSNSPAYRARRQPNWRFRLVPSLRLSRRTVIARSIIGGPDGQKFSRLWLSAGYGPEVGYQNGRGYFYFNYLLHAGWSDISWTQNGRDGNVSAIGISWAGELGFAYSFSEYWSARIFAGTLSEHDTWAEALARTTPGSTRDSFSGGATRASFTGISIGYCFEPHLMKEFKLRHD